MRKLLSEDIKTLVEFIDTKSGHLKEDVLNEVRGLYNELKEDPEFRGQTGYAGKDGDEGPQGIRGPMGPTPKVEIDRIKKQIRFQTGNLINEDTNESFPQWSDWLDIQGSDGLPGEKGDQGEKGEPGLIGEQGPIGPQGSQGDKGDPLTWDMLTEAQRQQLIGPMGSQGPKGDKGEPGDFPKYQIDEDASRIRFQISEDVMDPWGKWLDIPKGDKGDQGDKGEKGDPLLFEDLTQQQIVMLQGPKGEPGERGEQGPEGPAGPKGDLGERGPKGEVGPKGKDGTDFDPSLFKNTSKKFEQAQEKALQTIKRKTSDEVSKIRTEMERKLSTVGKPNELLIPSGSNNSSGFDVAGGSDNFGLPMIGSQGMTVSGSGLLVRSVPGVLGTGDTIRAFVKDLATGNLVAKDIPFKDGMFIFIDSKEKAQARQNTPPYDPNHRIVAADASNMAGIADSVAVKNPSIGKAINLYKGGIVGIDPTMIADGPDLKTGEYYYLSQLNNPQGQGNFYSQISSIVPQNGALQIVGQALNKRQLWVDIGSESIRNLNTTTINLIDSDVRTTRPAKTGSATDQKGDVWIEHSVPKRMYICHKSYNANNPTQIIWSRITMDSDNW